MGHKTGKRLLLEELKKKILKQYLVIGEKSGLDKNFDPKTHLKKLHGKLK